MGHRLFLGLRPPADVRAALLGLAAGGEALAAARWQTDAQLHLTLCFVGEVDRHVANALAEGLAEMRGEAFVCRLGPLGVFGRRGRVDTLWAGAAPREPLAALAARCVRLAEAAGAKPERRAFTPHITVARFGRHGPPEAMMAEVLGTPVPPLEWTADAVVLFESRLGAGGSHYQAVMDVPLQARG